MSRRETLQSIAGGAGVAHDSPSPNRPASPSTSTDPIAAASARLLAVVNPDDLPLPIVTLPVGQVGPEVGVE